ncbi:MAG: TM2 domain-containing protein [Bacteroidales bacterium]|nr:TM2 domain-containing protein [Bacteroidales bacterium]
MKKIFAVLVALFAVVAVANAANYAVDNASVDALFTEAVMEAPVTPAAPATPALSGDPQITNIVALVVDWIGLGGLGIHRLILGSKPINCLWYFLTIGGIFGIIPLIDGIMLIIDLINGSASYFDNPAFIMWL